MMMLHPHKLFASLMLMLGLGVGIQAQEVLVVVDDDAGNDTAYVDGTGGNLTGATAVQAAIAAINADPTAGIATWRVQIVDTDGAADTYTGDIQLNKAGTIVEQVANGSGTDASVTLIGDFSLVDAVGTVRIAAADCEVRGLSPAVPMLIGVPIGTPGASNIYTVQSSTAVNAVFSNITSDVTNMVNNDFATGGSVGSPYTVTLNHCVFNTINGVQDSFNSAPTPPSIAFNDCTFNNTNIAVIDNAGGPTTWTLNRCTVNAKAFNPFWLLAPNSTIRLIDCTLQPNQPLMTTDGGRLAAGVTMEIENPTINGTLGALPFLLGNTNSTLIVRGTPGNKADLRGVSAGADFRLGRVAAGTVIFEDVRFDQRFDSFGQTGVDTVNFTLEGCEMTGLAMVGWTNAATGPRNITARNNIIDKTGVTGAEVFGVYSNVIAFHYAGSTGSTIDIQHNTFFGGANSGVANTTYITAFGADATPTISYNIFDADAMDWAGVGINVNPASQYNIIDGNWNAALPANTLAADPALDASGVPQATSGAIDYAAGSTFTLDYLGAARPFGAGVDAGAFETAFAADIALSDTVLSFPEGSPLAVDVEQGETAETQTLDIQNAGALELTVTGLTFGGANASDFSLVSPPTLPFTIAPSGSQTLTVEFAPATTVRTLGLTASLTIDSDDSDEASVVVTLDGDAVPVELSGFSVE